MVGGWALPSADQGRFPAGSCGHLAVLDEEARGDCDGERRKAAWLMTIRATGSITALGIPHRGTGSGAGRSATDDGDSSGSGGHREGGTRCPEPVIKQARVALGARLSPAAPAQPRRV